MESLQRLGVEDAHLLHERVEVTGRLRAHVAGRLLAQAAERLLCLPVRLLHVLPARRVIELRALAPRDGV